MAATYALAVTKYSAGVAGTFATKQTFKAVFLVSKLLMSALTMVVAKIIAANWDFLETMEDKAPVTLGTSVPTLARRATVSSALAGTAIAQQSVVALVIRVSSSASLLWIAMAPA